MQIPKRTRGRQSKTISISYREDLTRFIEKIIQFNSTLDFQVSSRGWCYLLETLNEITKAEFDDAQKLINDCRKSGLLPMDICVEDDNRSIENNDEIDISNVEEYLKDIKIRIKQTFENYQPKSFWHDKKVYIEMKVEKIDLRSLFLPVCEKYHVPISNARGWDDINSKYNMMIRFKHHEKAGRQCVLLYCGDHDPSGLNISRLIPKHLAELKKASGWDPKNLIFDRFGLNYDFIQDHKLTWIDNLITSSKKDLGDEHHKDHYKPYVQDYIKEYGKKKCEANALIINVKAARKLCEKAILKYLKDRKAPDKFNLEMEPYREKILDEWNDPDFVKEID